MRPSIILSLGLSMSLQSLFAESVPLPSVLASYPEARSEVQYWTYEVLANQPRINTPWDQEEGDGLRLDPSDAGVHGAALTCRDAALREVEQLFAQETPALLWKELASRKSSLQLLVLVNVLAPEWSIESLRRFDRDAYFWHWSDRRERPVLAFSDFRRGQWVWEVLAFPDRCVQPDADEAIRFLRYGLSRLPPLSEPRGE